MFRKNNFICFQGSDLVKAGFDFEFKQKQFFKINF